MEMILSSGQPLTAGGLDASFGRQFVVGQDWSTADGLRFWYYGRNTGDVLTVQLLDNRVADQGPAGWTLEWSDEFNGPAGQPPRVSCREPTRSLSWKLAGSSVPLASRCGGCSGCGTGGCWSMSG